MEILFKIFYIYVFGYLIETMIYKNMENFLKIWFELWLIENLKITLEILSLSKFEFIFLAIHVFKMQKKTKKKKAAEC